MYQNINDLEITEDVFWNIIEVLPNSVIIHFNDNDVEFPDDLLNVYVAKRNSFHEIENSQFLIDHISYSPNEHEEIVDTFKKWFECFPMIARVRNDKRMLYESIGFSNY